MNFDDGHMSLRMSGPGGRPRPGVMRKCGVFISNRDRFYHEVHSSCFCPVVLSAREAPVISGEYNGVRNGGELRRTRRSAKGSLRFSICKPQPLQDFLASLLDRQEDVAKRIVDAVIAADKKDGLGYMEASPFDVGLRGGWRKAGPPHRQRLLRLSVDGPGG